MASVIVLYDFKFTQGRIFELSFPDVTAKDSKHQWMLILDGHRHDLKFRQMTEMTRTLVTSHMEIFIDLRNLTLRINCGSIDMEYHLKNQLV